MSECALYHDGNRQLQDQFGSRELADRLEEKLARTEFTPDDKAFIESLPYFFLATADAEGRPDCSFKGGMPGFVRVIGAGELAFPDYDGNGMFKSLGNLLVNPNVGMLFIAMHGKPQRLRVNGTARGEPRRPAAGLYGRRADDRPGHGAGHFPQLPAIHTGDGTGRAIDLCAAARLPTARAGVEGLRHVQGRRSAAPADVQG